MCPDRSRLQDENLIAVGGGEVEVVQRGDRRDPEPANQAQGLVLMPDIQVRRRLVEDEQARRLRKRPGDHHALLFAAGERVELALGQRRDARRARAPTRRSEGPGWYRVRAASCAARVPSAPSREPRTPSRSDAPAARRPRRARRRSPPGPRRRGHRPRPRPRVGTKHAVDASQQTRLAAAVRTDERHERARVAGERRVDEDARALDGPRHAADVELHRVHASRGHASASATGNTVRRRTRSRYRSAVPPVRRPRGRARRPRSGRSLRRGPIPAATAGGRRRPRGGRRGEPSGPRSLSRRSGRPGHRW